MRSISRDDDMPCLASLFNWLRTQPEFLEQYTIAKEQSTDALFEEILDIADDGTNDWMEKHGEDGENTGWKINGEALGRSRLRVDTRKWALSKLKPKKYGDRIAVAGDPDNPLTMMIKEISGNTLGPNQNG